MVRNRKRKVAVANNEEKENESRPAVEIANPPAINNGPMNKIMNNVQTSEALHKKYIKEMQQLYTKMDHDAFMFTFIKMIKVPMVNDESNEYAFTTLQFCAKFIASYNQEDTHPILISIFEWITKTISGNPHIRFRLCQFVNLILKALGIEAALDDNICDKILEYMADRLRDLSPSVRVEAIIAMQRLQVPDNPNDAVLRAYQYHLCSDPSPRVRQAVITCMGRNYITIPYILDRLWDIDDKVRRHTYVHMSSYPVRSYKVSQRLMLLEQGLNDRAETVRKVVTKIMLRQWLESYQKDIIALVSALKLDANEAEIERFNKVTKQMLIEIFKSEERETLLALLPIDYEGEFNRCVLQENLSVEIALYWECLSTFLQAEGADEFDHILPELTVFCAYVQNFSEKQQPDVDKFQRLEFQNKLHALLEILYQYDLGDEIGRGNLNKLIGYMLRNISLDDKNIEIIVRCAENLITDQNKRLQFFTEIVQDLCQLNKEHYNLWNDRNLINEALANCADPALNLKLSELKVKILDLEEQEMTLLQNKNYVNAQEITDEKNIATEEYTNLLKPLLTQPLGIKKVKNENILTALQIIYHMVVSEKVRSLSPEICKLYNDFICRHIASAQIIIRDWALKCGTAYSMHYEPIAKDLFNELYSQFFKHHNARIWETSVKCIFEIMDTYGIDGFSPQEQANTASKRTGRILYNTLESLETDDETQVSVDGQGVSVIYMMSHFLDTCDNTAIVSEIILGFIKLICHGFIKTGDIIEKLLIRYFNPSTDTKINQYLSIFLEEMIKHNKQNLLVPSLLPTISAVLSAPYDSPLLEIRPETITRFFIDITRQDSCAKRPQNLHTKIVHSFLTEMLNNANNKELCKLLAKELLKLEVDVRSNATLQKEMTEMANKLLSCEFDVNTLKNIKNFQGMLDGTFNPPPRNENESDEDADEDTVTNENQQNSASVAETIIAPLTTISETIESNTVPSEVEDKNESTLTPEQQVNASQEANNSGPSIETEKTTSTECNEPSVSESAIVSAPVVAEAAKDINEGSQVTPPGPTTLIQLRTQFDKVPTPVTTFGPQNQIGQHCLRKSLNSLQTQTETEISDPVSVPKIRIEVRIDSEKKKTTTTTTSEAAAAVEQAVSGKKQSIPPPQTPSSAAISASGRSLRQLRSRRKSVSPEPRVISDTTSSSEEESTESDIVPESPQNSRNTTRLNLTAARLRRVVQTQNEPNQNSTEKCKTPSTRGKAKPRNEPQSGVTPRQNPTKTTTTNTPQKITKSRVKSPRKVLYTTLSAHESSSSRKRRFPRTPHPKNAKKQTGRSSSESPSSSSKSPRRKQPRNSSWSPKTHSSHTLQKPQEKHTDVTESSDDSTVIIEKTPTKNRGRPKKNNDKNPPPPSSYHTPQKQQQQETHTEETESIDNSSVIQEENPSKNRGRPKKNNDKTPSASAKKKQQQQNQKNNNKNNNDEPSADQRRRSASTTTLHTRSSFQNDFRMNNIMTRNKTGKMPPPSRIPVKTTTSTRSTSASSSSNGRSRSSSSSPLRNNRNIKPNSQSNSAERFKRASRIPRKLK